ncbi:hypothetical protein [Vitreimonas flagellata]|uniref:hypothetical protein n=1 Tax=Vitreimonas flagellata TaxID=2560861 RepID=UPI001075330F|nr:hypothetical protein [Vitreimonas flagellata]
MRLLKALILATAFLSASAGAALAQTGPDFVLNVPVRIENAPPLANREAEVRCQIQAYQPGTRTVTALPRAQQRIRIGPTGFRETLRFEFSFPPGVPRSHARYWNCELALLEAATPSGEVVSVVAGNVATTVTNYTSVTGQSVASSNVSVNGTFGP